METDYCSAVHLESGWEHLIRLVANWAHQMARYWSSGPWLVLLMEKCFRWVDGLERDWEHLIHLVDCLKQKTALHWN